MDYRRLGRTDMTVSRVSFGAWAIGGFWGAVDDAESMRALHAAIDAGMNFIDTADVYGDGRSERLVARLKRERPGETIWVSAAGGAVGSVVGQLAKRAGCRVVGSAGGKEKCRRVVEELGFDACVDHRAGDLQGQLQQHLPNGLDVYFDNVGGDHLKAALNLANPFARFVECGMIAAYNERAEAPDNLFLIVGKKLTVRGFIVSDHQHREPAFLRHVAPLVRDGSLKHDETVVPGIEGMFDAFLDLLRGGAHTGKLVIDVRSG